MQTYVLKEACTQLFIATLLITDKGRKDANDHQWMVVIQSLSCVWLFSTPMDRSTPGSSVLHYLPEFAQIHVHGVGEANHLIFCHPLLLLPSIFPSVMKKLANIHWIMEKAREFQKNIYFCFTDYNKAFDCVDHNKLWKILKEMGILGHLTGLLRNLYVGQEATVRTGHGTTNWISEWIGQ